ncbi:MAG: TetR/AcrR family transcriptional regulator, partial [Gemmatimonadetes bacterium]|nr:TetR/AcrR family transcriptional regulator [Gemmatimonadota bacterium]
VQIERLARDLGIAKSGFYWHFEDRQDLIRQLLDYWAHEYTEVLSENPELRDLDPKSRLLRVAEMVQDNDLSRYDRSFRAWAARDAMVARHVDDVLRKRLDYVGQAFAELGFEGDELEMRTRLFVCYHSAETDIYSRVAKKRLRELLHLRVALLTNR